MEIEVTDEFPPSLYVTYRNKILISSQYYKKRTTKLKEFKQLSTNEK